MLIPLIGRGRRESAVVEEMKKEKEQYFRNTVIKATTVLRA